MFRVMDCMYQKNISLIANQSLAVLMFFVPYVIFQPPMTVIIRKLGPTYFLSAIIICWAAIMIVSISCIDEIEILVY